MIHSHKVVRIGTEVPGEARKSHECGKRLRHIGRQSYQIRPMLYPFPSDKHCNTVRTEEGWGTKARAKKPREQHLSFDDVKTCMTVALGCSPIDYARIEHRRWVPRNSIWRKEEGKGFVCRERKGELNLGMMDGRQVSSHVATRGGLHHRVRCDVCACIIDETTCGGSATPSRA